jgi:uncharacterized membrane protein
MLNAIALIFHLVAINVWVGGTFFAIVILGRAIKNIAAAQQLIVWKLVLERFFTWAWVAVFILLTSGTWMVYSIYGGFDTIPVYIMLMGLIALLMISVFIYIYFFPYRQYKRLVQTNDVDSCIQKLAAIRFAGTINMILGLCVVVVIGSGPYIL